MKADATYRGGRSSWWSAGDVVGILVLSWSGIGLGSVGWDATITFGAADGSGVPVRAFRGAGKHCRPAWVPTGLDKDLLALAYDTLSERLGNHGDKTGFFKRLFHTRDGPALIAPRSAGMPPPFYAYFADPTRAVYARMEEAVLASVWRRSKVTAAGVLVRGKDLAAEAPMPAPQFVAEVMRAYRNAHHDVDQPAGIARASDTHAR
jgi:hypothetical protein